MYFSSPNLEIRLVEDHDKTEVLKGMSREEVSRYFGVKIQTQEDAEMQMQWYKNHHHKKSGLYFSLISK